VVANVLIDPRVDLTYFGAPHPPRHAQLATAKPAAATDESKPITSTRQGKGVE